jgi:hypothetical protein
LRTVEFGEELGYGAGFGGGNDRLRIFGALDLVPATRGQRGGAQSGHLEKPIMKPSISRRDPINFGFGIVSGLSIGCPLFMLVGMIAHMI